MWGGDVMRAVAYRTLACLSIVEQTRLLGMYGVQNKRQTQAPEQEGFQS